jgi:hypothetical protein
MASDAEIENETSIASHAHLGFREVGRRVNFAKELVKPSSQDPSAIPE